MRKSDKQEEYATDNLDEQFLEQLFDSYFLFRKPLPEDGLILEDKTTIQIQDELLAMYPVKTTDIVDYMMAHGYSTMTEPDGTVAWAIWRLV